MKLPKDYEPLVMSLNTTELSVDNVCNRLLQEDMRRRTKNDSEDFENALNSEMVNLSIKKNFNKKKYFNNREEVAASKKEEPTRKKEVTCFRCQKTGHIAKYCRNKPSYRKNYNQKSANNVELLIIQEQSEENLNSINTENSTWLIDSGASAHMINDENLLPENMKDVKDISRC